MKTLFYQAIARTIQAISNCEKSGNIEWQKKHHAVLKTYNDRLPSGLGFDNGCQLDLDASTAKKIVIQADFHHMDNNGFYSGWGEYKVIVTPTLSFGFDLKVTGRDRNQIKEYIRETFHYILTRE